MTSLLPIKSRAVLVKAPKPEIHIIPWISDQHSLAAKVGIDSALLEADSASLMPEFFARHGGSTYYRLRLRKGDRAKQAWERRKRCRKHVGNLSVKPCR
jgi:hypothetical protein